MTNVARYNDLDNIGGIQKIWFAEVSQITSFTRPFFEFGALNAADGVWRNLYFTPLTASLKIEHDLSAKGSFYKSTVSGIIPKQTPENNYLLNQIQAKACVCKVLDANGLYRVVGSNDSPVLFSWEFVTGKSPNDLNSIAFTFSNVNKYPPMFITKDTGQAT